MGCFGDREKGVPDQTQKWDYITLSDFRANSTSTYLAYGWLWFMAMVSVAVYGLDTSTAVNLLVYNKWNSAVQPALPLKYSRWLFAACIMLSWVLCFYEWQRAYRVIKRGGVADSYMDPLAVTLQSMRSKGFHRFLVFKDLTKSKKGADYVALFTYFSFQGAVRVICAEGPRQVVNGMTLYAVLQADLIPNSNEAHTGIVQFFLNIQALANSSTTQMVVYVSMLFTLVIWVFSALSLITAAVLYVLFLWHYVPSKDGSLSRYCRRKVDKRLERIVEHKVKAAIEEEEREAQKAERKAERKAEQQRQKNGELAPPKAAYISRKPTLPVLDADDDDPGKDGPPPLTRQGTSTTVDTLPLYSGPPSQRNQSLRQPGRPFMPPRNDTVTSSHSNSTYDSDAPLLANAGYAGDDNLPFAVPAPAIRHQNSQAFSRRAPPGATTGPTSQRSFSPQTRTGTPGSMRSMNGSQYGPGNAPQGVRGPPPAGTFPPCGRDQGPPRTQSHNGPGDPLSNTYPRPLNGPGSLDRSQSSYSRPIPGRQLSQTSIQRPFTPSSGHSPPASIAESYEMQPQPAHQFFPLTQTHPLPPQTQSTQPGGKYVAFKPALPADGLDHPPDDVVPALHTGMDRTSEGQMHASRPSVPSHPVPSGTPDETPSVHEGVTTFSNVNSLSPPIVAESRSKYVAFNPSGGTPHTARLADDTPHSKTLLKPLPQRSLSVNWDHQNSNMLFSGKPGTEDSYFGHVQRSPSPQGRSLSPYNHRLTVEYTDILDAYGAATPYEEDEDAAAPLPSRRSLADPIHDHETTTARQRWHGV